MDDQDAGSRVVAFVYDRLQVDAAWSTSRSRGFEWWAGALAQRVWCGPSRDADGTVITPVHIETDLLAGVPPGRDTLARLAGINRLATLSAYVPDPAARMVHLHASVSVTEDNWPLARSLALHAAAIQVADAHAEAEALAEIFGAHVAASSPRDRPARHEPDEMLRVMEVYREHGERASPFGGDELAQLVHIEPRPWTGASSDVDTLLAELPFGADAVARLELDATSPHPALGSGLEMRLFIPASSSERLVDRLNRAELVDPDAHQTGAWALDAARGILFVTFVPTAAYLPNLSRALVYHMAARCQWAAGKVLDT